MTAANSTKTNTSKQGTASAPTASPTAPSSSTPPDPSQMTAEEVDQIAERLEKNEYPSLFDSLEDWHLLKAVAFFSPALVEPYIHLLELEVDED